MTTVIRTYEEFMVEGKDGIGHMVVKIVKNKLGYELMRSNQCPTCKKEFLTPAMVGSVCCPGCRKTY